MTDEQIIKALECHDGDVERCLRCPYRLISNCAEKLTEDAIALINRQKAEIEWLERLFEHIEKTTIPLTKRIYKEAITQYHHEVKKRCVEGGIYPAFVNRQMEDVRKEMVGEQQ